MKPSRLVWTVVFGAALLASQLSALARGNVTKNIPAALMVDPCRSHTDLAEPQNDQVSEVTLIDFLGDAPGPLVKELSWVTSYPDPHGGATFASLPKYQQSHIFVTRGDKLDVYDVGEKIMGWLSIRKVRTVSVGSLVGVQGLELGRVAPGNFTAAEAEPGALFGQHSLYLLATRPDLQRAYYIVIDQQYLIEGTAPTSTIVYGFGQICSSPTGCTTSAALDIRVGDESDLGVTEEAYITTVESFGSTDLQMTYRLERGIGATDFTLSPRFASYWKNAHNSIDPPMVSEASGLRFADDSSDAYVLKKFEWQVRNLADGTESCVLSGEPTDVAVWEPGIASAEPRYLLATSWDGSIGRLDLFPAGDCPAGNPASTLSILVGAEPTSMDLYAVDDDELWVLVVSKGSRLFEAIHLEFQSAGGVDSFTVLETRTLPTYVEVLEDSCPSFVQFGMRQEKQFICPIPPPGGCTGIDRKCLRNDPRCQ